MAENMNRQWLLAARPVGLIKESDFQYKEVPVPEPGSGGILARNIYLSLDPAMRGWMTEMESYIEPVQLGDVMRGGTIAKVVKSNNEAYAEGEYVFGLGGWQDYVVYDANNLPQKIPPDSPFPLSNFLSVLGITGLTAYFGLLDVCDPKAGETVVVSAGAGAVGSVVGQIAKIKGCRVVGTAGTDEKCQWIKDELGFDEAINYKTEKLAKALKESCPNKIDVYFDNVGGELLNTVLAMINVHARIAICGAISQYNATEPQPGPSNYITLLTKRSKMQGFIVTDYAKRFPEAMAQLGQWVAEEKIKHKEEIVNGLQNAPQTILRLFDGSNQGKLIIQIANP